MDFRLEVIDYVLIVAALVTSSAFGLYYGFVKKKNNSVEEYFLASRESSNFKVACSLFATVVSSGLMVGIVAETYYYGFQPAVGFFVLIPAHYIFMKLFFPVFYKIGNQDLYTYYELRFFKHIRYFLSFLAVVDKAFSNCAIIYGTATVVNSVSGIHTWTLNCIMTAICVLYSSLGGVRGVTLADTIQAFVIIGSVIAVLILGFINIGGVWERNWQSGRLSIFNFDFNMSTRYTFWSITIGNLFTYMSFLSTSIMYGLRLMASGSIKDCQRAGRVGVATAVAVNILCAVIGLLAYAVYHLCDPVLSGAVRNPNQLLSILIGDQLKSYTGLAGIFFAGLVCAAVSTLSSSFNGIAALIMETFVKPLNVVHSEIAYTHLAKITVVVHGALSLLGILVVEQFPNVYQAMVTIPSITGGPQFGLICIGMFFPQADLKSSIGGFISGLVFMLWLVVGSLLNKQANIKMPVSTSGCSSLIAINTTQTSAISNWTLYNDWTAGLQVVNVTNSSTAMTTTPAVINPWAHYFPFSSISFTWFTLVGILFTFIMFILLSLIFGGEKEHPTNVDLIPRPIQTIQKKLGRRWQKCLLCDVYSNDIRADQQMTATQSVSLMLNEPNTSDE